MNPSDLLSRLIANPHLDGVPEPQLRWLAENGVVQDYPAGASLYQKGDPVDNLFVMLEGRMRLFMIQGGQQVEVNQFDKDEISGLLPYSRMREATGNGVAIEPVKVLALHRNHFPALIQTQPELTETLVHLMLNRVRDFTKTQQQTEKMASLGKLSAGLAHELNNPASAVVRSAAALRKHLTTVPDKFKRVIAMRLTPAQVDQVTELLFEKLGNGVDHGLSLMEKTACEEDLADWMEAHGVENGYEMAETFVEYGLSPDDLDFIHAQVSGDYLPPVLEWMENVLTTEKMVGDIAEASGRIAALVGAVKEYSHMDGGADKQATAISAGIRSTLTMMQHKIRDKKITVEVEIPDPLPAVHAHPGELNQVWANLIDNALDALPDGGTLRIAAHAERGFVITTLTDNGAGIPEEVQGQVFDPFFTTKAVGKGTGLGLDIVRHIVQRHNGKVTLASRPGHTEFAVCLPV